MKKTILDKGYIEIVDSLGDDLTPVNAARVSFGGRSNDFEDRDKKLAKDAGKQVTEQMRNVQNRPGSVATSGSQSQEQSVDDKVFDMLVGVDENWNSLTS